MNPKVSLIIGILCISFSPIFVKLAGAPPITSGFYRIFIAWILPCAVLHYQKQVKDQPERYCSLPLAGGVVFGADIAVWNISLMKISATISTLLPTWPRFGWVV